jgi:uncharacterized protein YjbI with pentapeptide repeats
VFFKCKSFGVQLLFVDAQGAKFNKANLKDSSFFGANLQGASVVGAEFSRLSIRFHGVAHEPELMNQIAWNRWNKGREINFSNLYANKKQNS